MTNMKKDALLPITRVLLLADEWLFAGIGFFVAGVGALAAAAVALGYTGVSSQAVEGLPDVPIEQIAGGVFALTLLAGIMLLLLWQFIRRLRQLVETVNTDPFVRANARRLREMGWITLFAFIPTVMLTGVGSWFADLFENTGHEMHFDGGIDVGQIVLILLLFILARVFEHGADMREELEGTV